MFEFNPENNSEIMPDRPVTKWDRQTDRVRDRVTYRLTECRNC